jgi:hypothetical protein
MDDEEPTTQNSDVNKEDAQLGLGDDEPGCDGCKEEAGWMRTRSARHEDHRDTDARLDRGVRTRSSSHLLSPSGFSVEPLSPRAKCTSRRTLDAS